MAAIDWQRARPLLERALDLEPAELPSFLARECGDGALRDRLLALIAAERADRTFLEPPAAAPSPGPGGEPGALPRERVGSFRLVAKLGEGGMGSVWLGERDGDFRQRVAIKLLRGGFRTAEEERRFLRERRLLAELEHPCVARLVDGGTLEDGTPFLAMELVEGLPIDAWVAARGLEVARILELFVRVCEAVQVAHARGIVHRDLKPTNVLVTEEGMPKLLDFGIAKLLAEEGAETQTLTRTGDRLLTPRYASPEQVRGGTVTPATDVFALGVLLYELLTGRSPHAEDATTWRELEESILNLPARRPSLVAARERRTRLRGDLDVVLLRALSKEPARRYPSAGALGEDLRRHLAGLPVLARPDSLRYRAAKYVRRNKALVGASLGIVTALSVGLAFALHGYLRAEDQRKRTGEALAEVKVQRGIADEINTFFTEELLRAADPGRSHKADVTMREVLDAASLRIEGRFPDAPLVEAAVRHALGGTYLELGMAAAAEPHLRRALELRLAALGADAVEVFEVERDLIEGLRFLERTEEGIELSRALLERMTRVLGKEDGYTMVQASNLSSAYAAAGRLEEAIQVQRELLETRLRVFGPDHESTLTSQNKLGSCLIDAKRPAEALPFLEAAVAGRARLLGDDDPATLLARGNLASVQFLLGDAQGAMENLGQVLEIQQRVLPPDHPHLLNTLNNLASMSYGLARPDQNERWIRLAWEGWRARGELHLAPGRATTTALSRALLALDRAAEAEELVVSTLASFPPEGEARELELALADVYDAQGRSEEAALLREDPPKE